MRLAVDVRGHHGYRGGHPGERVAEDGGVDPVVPGDGLGTVLVACGVLGLWLLGPWVVRFVYPPEYASATLTILPWYAAAMVPLSLANVLVNDLLARSRFQTVPFLVLLAVAYGVALTQYHNSFVTVLKTLCVFNSIFFLICVWFTFFSPKPKV